MTEEENEKEEKEEKEGERINWTKRKEKIDKKR
jgi:hypothetical protein